MQKDGNLSAIAHKRALIGFLSVKQGWQRRKTEPLKPKGCFIALGKTDNSCFVFFFFVKLAWNGTILADL